MATPQESITTVSGRRCTRSRARTAATSTLSEAVSVAPTEFTSTTTTTEEQQIETSSPAAIIQSSSVAVSISTSAPLANISPAPPAAVAPDPGAVVIDPVESETEAVVTTSQAVSTANPVATTPTTTSTSSDSIDSAVSLPSTLSSVISQPASPAPSSVEPSPEQPQQPPQPNEEPASSSTDTPAGGSSGLIGPDEGLSDPGPALTISSNGANVGGIVGGVLGAFAVVVLVSVLLFLCLKRRRSREPFAKWQQRISEKEEKEPGFMAKLKAIPTKLMSISAAVGVVMGKLRKERTSLAENPYNRQSVRISVSSVYSSQPGRRSQSIREPPSRFRQQIRGFGDRFGDRMPSLKRSRSLLQKKQDSLIIGARSPFPGIVEDPVVRNSKGVDNPFGDPEALDPPRTLLVLNPDLSSREGTPRLENGMDHQQRGPILPKAAALSNRGSIDPFASILDELAERRGSSTPDWLRDTGHKRTQSAATALRSHPPSTYTASVYTTADDPFVDAANTPPVPQQPLPLNPPRRPVNPYTSGLPTFNATSSAASRESTASFYFGEPGPSRPTTNMFSEVSVASAVPRAGRQSDPFDLDRPEVLGFGRVGGRQVRASVTRQNSKTNRMSSVPNWVNLDEGPYERASAIPGPLRNPTTKK